MKRHYSIQTILIPLLLIPYSVKSQQLPLLQTLYEFTNNFTESITDTIDFLSEYDFIIIGSGSGGSVVANRLSEEHNWNVLLLEAGEEENFLSDVPLTPGITVLTKYNWGYKTEKQTGACTALKGGVCNWPKGHALGGTSVINFMIYQRGHKRDFDKWAQAGNKGWSYEEVLPYFRKSERIGIPELMNSKYHGKDGYLDIQYGRYRTPLATAFVNAGKEHGYEINDPNGESVLGFSYAQGTLRNGRRCSAAKAFLRPIFKRKNLHISMRSRVTKILINPTTRIAYGVEFLKNRKKYRINAKKEVILAAGTIASPQLLMLSGVGPRTHLEKFNIPVIEDLRVGYNLQDHVTLNGLVFPVEKPVSVNEVNVQSPKTMIDYIFNGKGPYTIPGGAEGLAFIKTINSTSPPDYPDIEIVIGAGGLAGDTSGTLRNMLGITDDFYYNVYKDIIGKDSFGLVPVLMQPKSRGRIRLKSSNPFHWPIMEPNFYDDRTDLTTLIEGVKMALQIANSKSFKKYGATFHKTPFPGCKNYQFGSDSYWECCIRGYASSLQHQVGTCKMGPANDPDAVVNDELRVYGIQNLRVIDASIMPTIPAAHTNAATFMIGEKGADMIKNFWKNRKYYVF